MNLFPKTQGSVQPAQIRRSTLTAICLQRQGASLLTILSGCMGRRKAPGWADDSPLAGQTMGTDGWPARKILYEAVKFRPQIISVLDSPTDLIFKNNNNNKKPVWCLLFWLSHLNSVAMNTMVTMLSSREYFNWKESTPWKVLTNSWAVELIQL